MKKRQRKLTRSQVFDLYRYLEKKYAGVPQSGLPTLKLIAKESSDHLGFQVTYGQVSETLLSLGYRKKFKRSSSAPKADSGDHVTEKQLKEIRAAVRSVNRIYVSIDNIKVELLLTMEKVDRRIARLSNRVEECEKGIPLVENDIIELRNRVTTLESDVSNLRENVNILIDRDSSRYEKMIGIEVNAANNHDSNRRKINKLVDRMRKLEGLYAPKGEEDLDGEAKPPN